MATTGLYSQHLHNRKVLYLRNTIIAIILIVLAAATLFPICYMFLSAFGPNVATAGNPLMPSSTSAITPGGGFSTALWWPPAWSLAT